MFQPLILCVIIEDVHQYISHFFIPLDLWFFRCQKNGLNVLKPKYLQTQVVQNIEISHNNLVE